MVRLPEELIRRTDLPIGEMTTRYTHGPEPGGCFLSTNNNERYGTLGDKGVVTVAVDALRAHGKLFVRGDDPNDRAWHRIENDIAPVALRDAEWYWVPDDTAPANVLAERLRVKRGMLVNEGDFIEKLYSGLARDREPQELLRWARDFGVPVDALAQWAARQGVVLDVTDK